jgi:hypothetical protein
MGGGGGEDMDWIQLVSALKMVFSHIYFKIWHNSGEYLSLKYIFAKIPVLIKKLS